MKKLIIAALLICGAFTAKTQNSVEISIEEGLCVSNILITYDNGSEEWISPGCEQNSSFGTDENTLSFITVNDVQCPMDKDTVVRIDDGKFAEAQVRRGKITFKAKEGATQ
jgi:hypothetical protein